MLPILRTPGHLLKRLLGSGILALLGDIVPLLKKLSALVDSRRLQGIYDVLCQQRTIEIHDRDGDVVTVDTVEKLRFRQNHVAALTDYVWGDGEILADYRCSPGVPVDCYKEGSRYAVLISLREHKHHGEEMVLRTHRMIRSGFTRSQECWENDIYHRMGESEILIVFPKERQCQRATVARHNTGRSVALGPEHFQTLPDGRQQLSWSIRKPRLHERYVLHWEW